MNNKKNEPHESACKGTCENTSITGGIPEKGGNTMALSDKEIECIKAEVLDKMTQCETVNFNAINVGIEKNLVANKDNLYAQEGLAYIKNFNQKIHDTIMNFYKSEKAKLSNHNIDSDKPEYKVTSVDTDWISTLTWTKKSMPQHCQDVVLSAKQNASQYKLEAKIREFQAFLSDRTSERDKFYCSYHSEVSNYLYDIQMKIIHKEYSKLMKSTSYRSPAIERFVSEVMKNGTPS